MARPHTIKQEKKKQDNRTISISTSISHDPKKLDYFTFLKKYSTNENYTDKDRYNKVKITSLDSFNDCILKLKKGIAESEENTPFLFTGAIDGVDEILSAYANIAQTFSAEEKSNVFGIFFDINPNKINYFTFRLFLALLSEDAISYLRNLFYFDIEPKKSNEIISLLESAYRNNPSKNQHKNYLLHLLKTKMQDLEPELKMYFNKGIETLYLMKFKARNYRNLSKMLKDNILLNPETHWLSNDKLFNIIKDACSKNLIKIFQANINLKGKSRLIEIIKETKLTTDVIYIPKRTQKFQEASDLINLFNIVIDTQPPSEKTGNYRIWNIADPERFFTKPIFKHEGELSSKQLTKLTKEYMDRAEINVNINDELNLILMGDVPFGRSYLDERSTTFLKNLQQYSKLKKVPSIVLCGDVLDGEHTREKRKLALLQYLTEAPTPSLEQQCDLAVDYLSKFNADVYSVVSDGDWDIIEEKQRELVAQKEFEYKIENKTKHIPDRVRKSLMVESVFESAKQYYGYFESKIKLKAKLGDKLNLNFPTGSVRISHMNIGQYFRRSLPKQIGVKEQLLINQLTAIKGRKDSKDLAIKVSSHDNVLHAHMENESTLNLRVPSLESSDRYMTLPIHLRNAVQDMMHKAFAVRGKVPFPASCHVRVTKDNRILLTILNEKVIEFMKQYQGEKFGYEYIIFDLADAQIGSISYSYEYLIKYLDYVKFQAEKLAEKPNTKVRRIALLNGDIIEGINYSTAMMRNSPTKLVIPQTQISYVTELLKPFLFHPNESGITLDRDIMKIVLTHGNHEYNSGFSYSGMVATYSLYQYLKGHIERDLAYRDAKNKLTYSLFTRLDQEKLIFSSIGAFSCMGLNIYCTHSYGGKPNIASASPSQEKWVGNIGSLAKKWDVLIQGHYHKFSVGECAGKILLTFPSFAEVSDFEYERGLSAAMCGAILHLSTTEGLTIEILTKKFFDTYQCNHDIFKKFTVKQLHEKCTEMALEPVDLSDFS